MSLMMPDMADLKAAIRDASAITVVTGAGISASAGIPTYRDKGSGWTDGGLERKMHASRYGNHLPELWQFWGSLRAKALAAGPTSAHRALADSRVSVLTQNIDGLHTLAGSETIELHGSVLRSSCIRCKQVWKDHSQVPAGVVPDCPECGYQRRTRVDVVLFGEVLKRRNVDAALAALQKADVCLYIGTSGNVWPVADFVKYARQHGAMTALINRDPWDRSHTDFDVVALGDADVLVPDLFGINKEVTDE